MLFLFSYELNDEEPRNFALAKCNVCDAVNERFQFSSPQTRVLNPLRRARKKDNTHFSVVLNGEFARTKISAENLFSLPICAIMGLTKSLPPSGRGTALAVEGACVTLGLNKSYCIALSLSRLRRQLPPGGSLRARASLGVWALPDAGVACNAVIQMRNWR